MAKKEQIRDEELTRLHEFNKQIEELKDTEFFYNIFAVSPASIAISRLEDRRLVAVNDGFSALFGYDPQEALGKTAEQLALNVDETHRINVFERLREGEIIRRQETSIRTQDGSIRRVVGSFFVIEALGTKYAVTKLVDVTQMYELREKVLQASQRERQRIGQDLHDGVSSQLAGIDMMLSTTIGELEDEGVPQVQKLRRIRKLLQESAEDARRLSHGLNPIRLSKGTLVDALKELARNTNDISGVSAEFDGRESIPELSKDTATQLYWIAQEAVDNARHHAGATSVTIQLLMEGDDRLVVKIRDDGSGFAPSDVKEGMGLETIRYRAELIGAQLEIESRPENGTSIRCIYPLGRSQG